MAVGLSREARNEASQPEGGFRRAPRRGPRAACLAGARRDGIPWAEVQVVGDVGGGT